MPTTRSGTKTSPAGGNASKPMQPGNASNKQKKTPSQKPIKRKSDAVVEHSEDKENHMPEAAEPGSKEHSAKKSKRSSVQDEKETVNGKAENDKQDEREKGPDGRPILKLLDLEFVFDRSQLRDPRPTPGRKARPRYSSFELDGEQNSLKRRLES